MPRLLLIDDDLATCAAVSSFLTGSYEVRVCHDGEDFEESIRRSPPDLILLDINLPGRNGLKLLSALGPLAKDIPVLMISVRGGEEDMLAAFRLGAVDYVTKPFSLKVLKARLDRLLATGKNPAKIQVGPAIVDLAGASITFSGETGVHPLTQKELLVLRFLLAHPRQILNRQQFLDYAWGYDYEGTARTVDNVMVSLRRKLRDSDTEPLLKSHRGLGYSLSLSEP
jgi:DNA-binding response OmpR family regulator